MAGGVKQKVFSIDKAMNIGMSDLWFSNRSFQLEGELGWQQRMCKYSEEVEETLNKASRRTEWLWKALCVRESIL